MHLVGIKGSDLRYKYFISNYKPRCKTGDICNLNVAEQINYVNCTSSAKHSSWHHDDDEDDTNVTMIF